MRGLQRIRASKAYAGEMHGTYMLYIMCGTRGSTDWHRLSGNAWSLLFGNHYGNDEELPTRGRGGGEKS